MKSSEESGETYIRRKLMMFIDFRQVFEMLWQYK